MVNPSSSVDSQIHWIRPVSMGGGSEDTLTWSSTSSRTEVDAGDEEAVMGRAGGCCCEGWKVSG
jgi:hypothetical protein